MNKSIKGSLVTGLLVMCLMSNVYATDSNKIINKSVLGSEESTQVILYIGITGIFVAIIVLTAIIIMSKDTAMIPLTLFNKQIYETKSIIELKEDILIKSYKKSLEQNDKLLEKKNGIFNNICILGIITIGITIILQLFKICI